MFNGKIAGLRIAAESLAGISELEPIPQEWFSKAEVLKSHPGIVKGYQNHPAESGVFPIIHCLQEIPCNPCTTVCPTNSIHTEDGGLMAVPLYDGSCIGCYKCVLICPGLAITLVDYRKDASHPTVTIPYEISNLKREKGDLIELVDIEGQDLGSYPIDGVMDFKDRHIQLIKVLVPAAIAKQIASFRVQDISVSQALPKPVIPDLMGDDAMICLCERVSVGQVRKLVKSGITDLNQIKAITRAGMGPCGAKTCETLIKGVLREEGVPTTDVVPNTKRPVFIEVPLDVFPDGV